LRDIADHRATWNDAEGCRRARPSAVSSLPSPSAPGFRRPACAPPCPPTPRIASHRIASPPHAAPLPATPRPAGSGSGSRSPSPAPAHRPQGRHPPTPCPRRTTFPYSPTPSHGPVFPGWTELGLLGWPSPDLAALSLPRSPWTGSPSQALRSAPHGSASLGPLSWLRSAPSPLPSPLRPSNPSRPVTSHHIPSVRLP
jgi:hypothetical protein